jgi:hypothetical protein
MLNAEQIIIIIEIISYKVVSKYIRHQWKFVVMIGTDRAVILNAKQIIIHLVTCGNM